MSGIEASRPVESHRVSWWLECIVMVYRGGGDAQGDAVDMKVSDRFDTLDRRRTSLLLATMLSFPST
jgi:hypothetical protein